MNWSRKAGGGRRRPTRDPWEMDQPAPDTGPFGAAGRPVAGGSARPPGASVERENATAVVKWFNAQKGFGFATPDDGSADVFLHISALERAGFNELPEGATIVCDIGRGQRGLQVVAVHAVDASTATPSTVRPPRDAAVPVAGAAIEGTVKWFNAEKGFGFITPDGGGNDVFVHIKAVQRAGLDTLEAGDRVSATVKAGRKGPEADSLLVI